MAAPPDPAVRYRSLRSRYTLIASHVRSLLESNVDSRIVHTFTDRSKEIESFDKKMKITIDDGSLKYSDPLNEITDLAGVRVIVYVKNDVEIVCDVVNSLFKPYDSEDVGERVYKQGRFGYQSRHFLVELDKPLYLARESKIRKAVCEIQVRTLLQHAWAEMEHDIQYKAAHDIPMI